MKCSFPEGPLIKTSGRLRALPRCGDMQLLKIAAAVIAAGCLIAPLQARAALDTPESPVATIAVTGQGSVSRAPDLATVAATIVTSDDNATRALSENNRRYAALLAKLGTLGIAASDITSTSLQSYFNPRPKNEAQGGAPFGFVVTRNVAVNVAAMTQTGAVIDAATAAGATQINGVSYGFRDRRAVERAALAAAVADAYAQAQAIATAAHVQIVRVLRIGNESGPLRMPAPLAMSMARTAEAAVPTTVNPTDLDVTSTISVTYVIR
jgi:uncharacterized protein YggE